MDSAQLAEILAKVLGVPVPEDLEATSSEGLYAAYKVMGEATAAMKEYSDLLREEMFHTALADGTKDEKGSLTVKFADGTGYKKEARTSVNLNKAGAISLAREKALPDLIKEVHQPKSGSSIYDICLLVSQLAPECELVEAVEDIDEAALEQAVINGLVSDKELQTITDVKTTYALVDLSKKRGRS